MLYAFLMLLLIALSTIPGMWVRWTISKHNKPKDKIQFTGEEFANSLLIKFHLNNVVVESAPPNQDHYDPTGKAVRLSPERMNTNSLAAIAIAAHEVGHALQDATQYPKYVASLKIRIAAQQFQRVGSWILLFSPVVALISKNPIIGLITAATGIISYLFSSAISLYNLPVEFDASFQRALPILKDCQYLDEQDLKSARKILRAAAMTYVAGSILSFLPMRR
ncbi:hypothetical protein A9Q99_15900 [Gammaproteobacteria bacterium 45_16_T64]|nr:hypothetical protein A9Q99_15900 [Gammaproteobacteria bacterium 45_16_T64]